MEHPQGFDITLCILVFVPEVDPKDKASEKRDLQYWHDGYTNYRSADLDDATQQELDKLVAHQFVKEFDTIAAVRRVLGEDPVLCELALIAKETPRARNTCSSLTAKRQGPTHMPSSAKGSFCPW